MRTLGKYYIVDIGFRNYLLGFRNRDTGHVLENIVYFELIRRGYDVAVGKVDSKEVDFIATKADDKIYEKIVLSLDTGLENSYEGIKSINLIDWLIS